MSQAESKTSHKEFTYLDINFQNYNITIKAQSKSKV